MKIYIQDTLLSFSKVSSQSIESFDRVLRSNKPLDLTQLEGNVVVNSHSFAFLTQLLDIIQVHKFKKLNSITFPFNDEDAVKKYFKERYNYIKASGGLVVKEGKYLLIYRLKKWDLPKGKLEKGEKVLECALREVEEECSVKVEAGPKIGSTWHCYPTKNGWCLKKSTWYMMSCTDDSQMKPQIQEDIEEIAWVAPGSVDKYLANSYGTIHDVFRKAQKKGLINLT